MIKGQKILEYLHSCGENSLERKPDQDKAGIDGNKTDKNSSLFACHELFTNVNSFVLLFMSFYALARLKYSC